MSLNFDTDNQVQEVIFPPKLQKTNHSFLMFNGTSVTQSEIQNQIRMFLDSKL